MQSQTETAPAATEFADLLEAAIVATLPATGSTSILDRATVAGQRPTQQQRDAIAALRAEAGTLGGAPAAKAAELCQPTEAAAREYIAGLTKSIAGARLAASKPAAPKAAARRVAGPVAQSGLPVTPKQWSFIRHLRMTCRRAGLSQLAAREIGNDRREASKLIDALKAALRTRYGAQDAPQAGGSLCVCGNGACQVGPFVPRG